MHQLSVYQIDNFDGLLNNGPHVGVELVKANVIFTAICKTLGRFSIFQVCTSIWYKHTI